MKVEVEKDSRYWECPNENCHSVYSIKTFYNINYCATCGQELLWEDQE